MSGADLVVVGRALQAVLVDAGTPLLLHDRATGETLPLLPELAGDPAALLPVFLVAGEAVWREASGKSFLLDIRRDASALLGYRACGIGAGTFATVMLSTMEAIEQALQADRLLVNDLIGSVWKAVLDRADAGATLSLAKAAASLASPQTGTQP